MDASTGEAIERFEVSGHRPNGVEPRADDCGVGLGRSYSNFGAEMEIAGVEDDGASQSKAFVVIERLVTAVLDSFE